MLSYAILAGSIMIICSLCRRCRPGSEPRPRPRWDQEKFCSWLKPRSFAADWNQKVLQLTETKMFCSWRKPKIYQVNIIVFEPRVWPSFSRQMCIFGGNSRKQRKLRHLHFFVSKCLSLPGGKRIQEQTINVEITAFSKKLRCLFKVGGWGWSK